MILIMYKWENLTSFFVHDAQHKDYNSSPKNESFSLVHIDIKADVDADADVDLYADVDLDVDADVDTDADSVVMFPNFHFLYSLQKWWYYTIKLALDWPCSMCKILTSE